MESPKGTDYPVDMLTDKGVHLPSPFILDGGDARTLIARVSVSGTPLLEKTINDFVKSHPKEASYLADFAYFAAQNNLDVLGNPSKSRTSLTPSFSGLRPVTSAQSCPYGF